VLIGATPEGRKELVGFTDGARESAQDWRDLLLDLKRRGLDVPPRLTIADGALGFWKAAGESGRKRASSAAGCTRAPTYSPSCQRASRRRPNALQEIWMAETKAAAETGVRRVHRELHAQIREGGRSTTSRPSTGNTCGPAGRVDMVP
jgi:hypothetical protein